MNGARINTTFGSFKQYEEIIKNVRKIGDIPVLLDLKGPEIRVKLAGIVDLRIELQVSLHNVSKHHSMTVEVVDKISY